MSNTSQLLCPGGPPADLCDTANMIGLMEFLQRSLVLVAVGVLMLVLAIGAFVSGGGGILIGLVLTAAGGHSAWRGLTKWQAESDHT